MCKIPTLVAQEFTAAVQVRYVYCCSSVQTAVVYRYGAPRRVQVHKEECSPTACCACDLVCAAEYSLSKFTSCGLRSPVMSLLCIVDLYYCKFKYSLLSKSKHVLVLIQQYRQYDDAAIQVCVFSCRDLCRRVRLLSIGLTTGSSCITSPLL